MVCCTWFDRLDWDALRLDKLRMPVVTMQVRVLLAIIPVPRHFYFSNTSAPCPFQIMTQFARIARIDFPDEFGKFINIIGTCALFVAPRSRFYEHI